ncbi:MULTISPECIES: hypothetical protein [Paenibacillus]|uniref:hypothetical protein n=1 Tax=Paenibacillus TaxID=44249 RepID=UPI0022B8CFEE|nr:hypothetical protein [Paenibacillus caseinilyticus]MCZ8520409.1 hypothetical protein [Paenibacillus caseinilyticus]
MGSLDTRWRSLLNKVRLHLRSRLKFSLGTVRLRAKSKDGLYADPAVRSRELAFLDRYDFGRWHEILGLLDYRLNLYHLDLLESCRPFIDALPLPRIRAMDAGSRTFYYLPALYHYYQSIGAVESVHGVEFDAYRRYKSGYTAYDYAQAYLRALDSPAAAYLSMDFLAYESSYNVGTFFLPFVTEEPLLHWGLPLDAFLPARLMAHAYERLESPGILIIANKGAEEQDQQHRILSSLRIPYRDLGPFTSAFYAYDVPRYLTIVTKPGSA